MISWVQDHWWMFSILPYMIFNIYIVVKYHRDEGPFDMRDPTNLAMHGVFLLGALWIFAALLICQIVINIYKIICDTIHGRHLWRWALIRRWLVWNLLWFIFSLMGVFLYTLSLASTNYHPSRFESWMMFIVIIVGSACGANWIEKELHL